MKLIVGLGNPGDNYQYSRHNFGFSVLDKLASSTGAGKYSLQSKFFGEMIEYDHDNIRVILLKPTTFMNNSGQSVRAVVDYYNIDPADVIVVYDELALKFGKLRLRRGGSSAGHNGIKSITQAIGENFFRVRLGIDNDISKNKTREDFVLSNFSISEKKFLPEICEQTARIINDLIDHEPEHTSYQLI